VFAIDRGRYGSDTVSTHALMRAGVLQLSRWGVLDGIKKAGTPVIRSTSFHYGDEVVTVQIKPQHDLDGLYAPRRTVIDKLLVDAARHAGAEVAFETHLVGLVRAENGRVCGVRLKDSRDQERQLWSAPMVFDPRLRVLPGRKAIERVVMRPAWSSTTGQARDSSMDTTGTTTAVSVPV
jgi:flavin-dependent dehydrogenase